MWTGQYPSKLSQSTHTGLASPLYRHRQDMRARHTSPALIPGTTVLAEPKLPEVQVRPNIQPLFTHTHCHTTHVRTRAAHTGSVRVRTCNHVYLARGRRESGVPIPPIPLPTPCGFKHSSIEALECIRLPSPGSGEFYAALWRTVLVRIVDVLRC